MDGHFVPVVFYISLHYLIVIAGGGEYFCSSVPSVSS
jgi:hypothetical protein